MFDGLRRDSHQMKPLRPPDNPHVRAAEGWLELGNHTEAHAELEKTPPQLRAHPHVLNLRWEIYAAAEQWHPALETASALIQLNPEEPLGWIYRSKALHGLKRTREARDNLLEVVDRFPVSVTVLYDLACYECQTGHLEKARRWMERAFELGRARHQ